MTMIRRSTLVAVCVLLSALWCSRSRAPADDDRWIGHEFTPRTTCQPMIGNRPIPLQDVPLPFTVERVSGDWLWVGRAWVKKHEVVPVDSPIEEFDVARHGDILLLPVTIDGRKYEFMLDTGASWSCVDTTLRSLLDATGETVALNGRKSIPTYRLPRTHVGKSQLPVTGPAVCLDLEQFRGLTGHNIRGILGMTFLKDKVVRIDFDNGKLALLRSPPGQQDNSFAVSYSDGHLPMVKVEIGRGRTVSFKLDTGMRNSDSGNIEKPLFATLIGSGEATLTGSEVGSVTIEGEHWERLATVKECRLGAFQHADLAFCEGEQNILGLAYLARFRVTFDFPNDRIYLVKGTGFDRPRAENQLGAARVSSRQ
jgi:hypothetical protein